MRGEKFCELSAWLALGWLLTPRNPQIQLG